MEYLIVVVPYPTNHAAPHRNGETFIHECYCCMMIGAVPAVRNGARIGLSGHLSFTCNAANRQKPPRPPSLDLVLGAAPNLTEIWPLNRPGYNPYIYQVYLPQGYSYVSYYRPRKPHFSPCLSSCRYLLRF